MLTSSLLSAAQALRVFDKALSVTQNNVSNIGTPGYASQRLTLRSVQFDPDLGFPGGVMSGGLQSSRSEYAETAVWRRQHTYGRSDQITTDLERLEPMFDVSGDSGIAGALSKLFQSFSALTVTPNDPGAREAVLDKAAEVARQFNLAAQEIGAAGMEADQQIRSEIDVINSLATEIRNVNTTRRQDFRNVTDPALDARLYTALEELAEHVDFTVLNQADGTVTVLLGGQTPLVIGDRAHALSADSGTGSGAIVRDAEGRDITSQVREGRLAGLLDTANDTLPSLLEELNTLASALAGAVNATLRGGLDRTGAAGADLFEISSPENAAASLTLTTITADQIAAASAGAPGGNGNAIALAALASAPQAPLGGTSFSGYYGAIASVLGERLNAAKSDSDTQQGLLNQARSLREELSAVSLDEEAIRLIEFQRAYQATARLVNVLNELTETMINLI